jgi:hypothetical protein
MKPEVIPSLSKKNIHKVIDVHVYGDYQDENKM